MAEKRKGRDRPLAREVKAKPTIEVDTSKGPADFIDSIFGTELVTAALQDPPHVLDADDWLTDPTTGSWERFVTPFLRPDVQSSSVRLDFPWILALGGAAQGKLKWGEVFGHLKVVLEARDAHEAEVSKLKRQVQEQQIALARATADSDEREKRLRDLEKSNRELQDRQALSYLLNRVGLPAQERLLKNPSFRERFRDETPQRAFVVSIDVRRSTELMLKARRPKDFAAFVLTLARQIRAEIIAELGIFDKFTGDGVLAFFPEFFSGPDAGYRALSAITRCHAHFERLYREHRRCFTSILKDTGLGVGVDYGDVQLVEVGGEITVVGTPVVYACRMGAAPARCTYANQPAYEQLFERYSAFDFRETELPFKHEGSMLAYEVTPNGKPHEPALPDWLMEARDAASIPTGPEGSAP